MSHFSFDHRQMSVGRQALFSRAFSLALAGLFICGSALPAAEAAAAATMVTTGTQATEVPAIITNLINKSSAATFGAKMSLMTLADAAKRLHPTARAIHATQRASDARIAQAGVWANPAIEVSYGRTRPRIADLDSDRPYEVAVSQRLEWWGKRRARVAAAQADAKSTRAFADVALLDLEIEVRLAAISYTIAGETLAQAAAQAGLARELLEVVLKRQAVGDIDLGEVARVRVEASLAHVRNDASARAVATALAVVIRPV